MQMNKLQPTDLKEAFSSSLPQSIRNFLKHNSRFLRNLLNDKNVAMDSANFIEYPVPTTNRDPIFKKDQNDDKIIFFDFGSKGCYIVGLNDDCNNIMWNNQWILNKYLPAKALMQNAQAIYYLDKNDPRNFSTEKKAERQKNDYKNDPFTRHKETEFRSWRKPILDKSGYIVDPERLTKKLVDSGLYNPAKKTEKVFKRLQAFKGELKNVMDEVDLEDRSDAEEVLDSYNTAISMFKQAVVKYNYYIKQIEQAAEYKNNGWYDSKQYASACSSNSNTLESEVNRYLDRAEKEISKFIGYAVDWDTDDEI